MVSQKVKMTLDDIQRIENKLDIIKRSALNREQLDALCRGICAKDVPDLLVEIKRLRKIVYKDY